MWVVFAFLLWGGDSWQPHSQMFLLLGRPGKLLEDFSLHLKSQMSLVDSNLYICSWGLRGPHNFLVWNFPRRFIKTWADSGGEKFLVRSCERSDMRRGAGQGNGRNQGEWLEPMISLWCVSGGAARALDAGLRVRLVRGWCQWQSPLFPGAESGRCVCSGKVPERPTWLWGWILWPLYWVTGPWEKASLHS